MTRRLPVSPPAGRATGRRAAAAMATLIALTMPGKLRAQCPDGAPPPCAGARRAAARRAPPAPEIRARRFLLLPFRNVSRGEAQAWLEEGAPLMLGDGLTQFRELTVVPGEQVIAARRRLALAPDAAPDATQLRRLAEETGGWTVVSGSIIATGGRLRFSAQATDAATGAVLQRAEGDISVEADVRPAFDQLAVRLLEVAGLPPQASDVAAATTRSLDAYRAYVRGTTLIGQSAYARAREAFQEAVRLDSTFAMAWAQLAIVGSAWSVTEIVNPTSITYSAAARAALLAARLPPRQAARINTLTAFFGGRLTRARQIADSLARAEPDEVDGREFLSMFEMLDPALDSSVTPPTLRGSYNRAVAYGREVLERDPGRRHIYSVFGYVYAMAGGLWGARVPGVSREYPSYAATLMAPAAAEFFPVLRDSFEMLPRDSFLALPPADQRRLHRRAADAGMQWMQRWLAEGPNDADAHLWTARLAEVQGDFALSLRETDRAIALGIESQLENVAGRRLSLLLRTGRVAEAGALADSLARAGALRLPFIANFDRSWSWGVAALLLSNRWDRLGVLAAARPNAAGRPGCAALFPDIHPDGPQPLPDDVVHALMDTTLAHLAEARAQAALLPCLPVLQSLRIPRDSALAADLMPLRRFRPVSAVLAGDSVTLVWELVTPGPFHWDIPDRPFSYAFIASVPAEARPGAQQFAVQAGHRWHDQPAAGEGDLAALVATMTDRNVSARTDDGSMRNISGAVAADGQRLRVVVRGDFAGALRRMRPATVRFTAIPCRSSEVAERGSCPSTDLPLELR